MLPAPHALTLKYGGSKSPYIEERSDLTYPVLRVFVRHGSWSMPDIKVGDWVFFRASDGWNMSIRGDGQKEPVQCRRLKDTSIEGRIPHPDMIW